MTDAERFALLEQWYGDAHPEPQYNPQTLLEQIRWWERACERHRERARRAERVLSRWQCAASFGVSLSILLAVVLWWRS